MPQAGIASIGIKGPGYNGRRIGFDCSGSVAAVLAGAGVWQPTSGVPNDAGIIAELTSEHLIARGAGRGASEVTLYDDPGVHIFMNIDGHFFGTSDGGGGGNPAGGAGWLDDGAPDATSHVLQAVPPAAFDDRRADHVRAHPHVPDGRAPDGHARPRARHRRARRLHADAERPHDGPGRQLGRAPRQPEQTDRGWASAPSKLLRTFLLLGSEKWSTPGLSVRLNR